MHCKIVAEFILFFTVCVFFALIHLLSKRLVHFALQGHQTESK